jgi:hypothetical protein
MPIPTLKGVEKEIEVSLVTLESYWAEEKNRASSKKESHMKLIKIADFMESKKNAKDFIDSIFESVDSEAVPDDLKAKDSELGVRGTGVDEEMVSGDFNLPGGGITHKTNKGLDIDNAKQIDAVTGFNQGESPSFDNVRTIKDKGEEEKYIEEQELYLASDPNFAELQKAMNGEAVEESFSPQTKEEALIAHLFK